MARRVLAITAPATLFAGAPNVQAAVITVHLSPRVVVCAMTIVFVILTNGCGSELSVVVTEPMIIVSGTPGTLSETVVF